MKQVVFLACFYCCVFSSLAQTTAWTARYNGPASKFDKARAMCIDKQGNVYVTGPSEDKRGNPDYGTVKYNSAGVLQWAARYNGPGNGDDWPYAIAVDSLGNVYVTGRSMGSNTSYDFATVKYNPSGSQLWASRYSDSLNLSDVANDLVVDKLGNVFVTGTAFGAGNVISGYSITTVKFNSSGQMQWKSHYDNYPNSGSGPTQEEGISLVQDGNQIYVTGRSGNSAIIIKYEDQGQNYSIQWTRQSATAVNGRKIVKDSQGNVVVGSWGFVTFKYSATGDLLWESSYTGPAAIDGLWDMAIDASDNVIVTGYSRGSDGSNDYATVKYNSAGQQQWVSRYSGATGTSNRPLSVAVDGLGNCYVTGSSETTSGSKTDYATVKYNSQGVEQWVAIYDGPSNSADQGFVVVADSIGNVYVTGESAYKMDLDFATVKYLATAQRNSDPSPETLATPQIQNFTTYPNPFKGTTYIEFKVKENTPVLISVYDLQGKLVTSVLNKTLPAGEYRIPFKSGTLAAGIYYCMFRAKGLTQSSQVIVLE